MGTFYIEAIETGSITFSKYGFDETIFKGIVTYGVNDDSASTNYTFGTAISLNIGDKCYFKINDNATSDFSYMDYLNFSSTNKVNVGGNLSSLLGGVTNLKRNYQFTSLFSGMTNLINAKDLIFDISFNGYTNCCNNMFARCTSLITIPELPETTLTNACYSYMFSRCSSLKVSETSTSEYVKEYRIPKSGTGTSGTLSMEGMFSNTGGTYTSDPIINTTYYLSAIKIEAIFSLNGAGTITGSGYYNIGETCTLTASVSYPYVFKRWTLNEVQVSTNPTYSFIVSTSQVYVAVVELNLNFITDRTILNVDRVILLNEKIKNNEATAEEITEWANDLKGALNTSDLNRNLLNITKISQFIGVPVVAQTIQVLPTVAWYLQLYNNVKTLRDNYVVHSTTPALKQPPLNTYEHWNIIEQTLKDIFEISQVKMWYYCGNSDIYSGDNFLI